MDSDGWVDSLLVCFVMEPKDHETTWAWLVMSGYMSRSNSWVG